MKLGILGAGMIVREFLPWLTGPESPFKVEALCSTERSAGAAQALCDQYGVPRHTTSYDELLSWVDVVYIAVPNILHVKYTRAALEAGCHVIVEKPMAPTAALAEELAGRLQGQFMSGKFEVGEKLPPEPELMQIFGVGRSTVREAVRILSNMGFLKVRQGAGTFVERLTPPDEPMERRLGRADLHDLDEVRKILEVAIAEKAAERRTAHDAAVLEKHLAERGATAAAGALQACIEADVNFHIALAEATHNEILCELYRSTAAHLKKRFSNIYRDTECLLATQPTHGQLLGYILAGDVRNARETIRRILEEP